MVIEFILYPFFKFIRNAGGPDHHKFIFLIIVKQFRRPYIHRSRIMGHHRDEFLFRPMDQVFWMCISETEISLPTRSPYQMESTVARTYNRRIAHDLLLADFRLEPHTCYAVPMDTVFTINKPKALCGRLMKRGREIHLFFCTTGE